MPFVKRFTISGNPAFQKFNLNRMYEPIKKRPNNLFGRFFILFLQEIQKSKTQISLAFFTNILI